MVNFTYRLAPEHKYPAPLEDINTVVEWMYQHQERQGRSATMTSVPFLNV